MPFYINTKNKNSSREIALLLEKCIRKQKKKWNEIIFLCIGSDRVTGDCLGPFVGHQLSQYHLPGIFVYGTLEQPVNAVNLEDMTLYIRQNHPDALVIAVDASLGEKKHLGYVTIGNGALHPGAAVQKELPPVGDISITGIVNISGILEYLTLQTTRLSTVVSLADVITQGILGGLPQNVCADAQPSSGSSSILF